VEEDSANYLLNRDVYCSVSPPRRGRNFSSHLGRFLSCRGRKRRKKERKKEKRKRNE